MQYGHCVVSATATAINSLHFAGIAPGATAALSKAQKAFINSGARLSIFFSLARFALLYIILQIEWLPEPAFRSTMYMTHQALNGSNRRVGLKSHSSNFP